MTQKSPNILLINVDDLGWTDLSFMGSTFYETPNIDKLASQGTIFTRAYAAAANCAPSRACMLTGVMSSRHGVYTVGNSDRGDERTRRLIPPKNNTILPESFPTMASILKELGYETGMIGKWHLSDDPTRHGFDFNVGGCHHGHPPSYFAPYNIPTVSDGPDNEYLPERLAEEACQFIARDHHQPFFLYYSTYLVHTPIEGKDDLVEKYKRKLEAGKGTTAHFNPVYAAMIEALDHAVGKVLKTLDESGHATNTLVIFVSDNGGIRAISRQDPLRAGKGSYYEGGIRIPMTVRWPGHTPAGAVDHTPVTNMDFLPTFLRLAGHDPKFYPLDGCDLSVLFTGSSDSNLEERELFWAFPFYLQAYEPGVDDGRDPLFRTRPGAVLRQGRWKLHYYYEDDACELYDLDSDMSERCNRATEFPQLVSQMKSRLDQKLQTTQTAEPLGNNPRFDQTYSNLRIGEAVQAPPPPTRSESEWFRAMTFID